MKNKPSKVNCTASYALVQFVTWSYYAVILAFASNVLYEFGFSDSRISLFLGVFTALSVVVQVAAGELLSRIRKLDVAGVMVLFGTVMLLCAGQLLVPGCNRISAVGVFGVVCMLLQTLPSLANSMGMDSIRRGAPTNYSIARGIGSLGYSIAALLTGVLVRKLGVVSVHILTIAVSVLLIFSAVWYKESIRGLQETGAGERKQSKVPFFSRYPRFAVFLFGMAFLCVSHGLLCNFMFQIMLSRRGGAVEQGIATAISSLVELPIMFGFPIMLKKLRCDKWVRIASVCMLLKPVLILLAAAPGGIYLAQATQSFGYGLWVIGSVNYAEQIVAEGESIRAQSYHGAVTTVSTVLALSTGGVIIEHLGVQTMVIVSLVCSMIGAGIVLFSAQKMK